MTLRPDGEDGLMLRAAARAVARDRDITHTTLRVLKYLESLLGYKLTVGILPKKIAEELGINADEVNRAIRQLRIKGIVEQTRDANLKTVFRFNPSYGTREEALPPVPEPKARREVLTPEQEMLAMGTPTLFEP